MLGPNARNIFDEEPVTVEVAAPVAKEEMEPYARRLRVLLEEGDELLAVSEMAFYLIFKSSNSYASAANLYDLLRSVKESGLLYSVQRALAQRKDEEKVYLTVALPSEDLPEYLFYASNDPSSPTDLVDMIVEYAVGSGLVRAAGRCYMDEGDLAVLGVKGDEASSALEAARSSMRFAQVVMDFLGLRGVQVGLTADSGGSLVPCVKIEGDGSFILW